jgi:hypothetical protein
MKIVLFVFIFIVSRLVIEQYRTVSVAHSLYVRGVSKKMLSYSGRRDSITKRRKP